MNRFDGTAEAEEAVSRANQTRSKGFYLYDQPKSKPKSKWKEMGLDFLAVALTIGLSLPLAIIIFCFYILGRTYQLSEWAINRVWWRIK